MNHSQLWVGICRRSYQKCKRESLKLAARCPSRAFADPGPAFQVSRDAGEGPLEKERTRRECFHGRAELVLVVSSY